MTGRLGFLQENNMSKIVQYIKKHRFAQILLFLAAMLAAAFAGYWVFKIRRRRERQNPCERKLKTERTSRPVSSPVRQAEKTRQSTSAEGLIKAEVPKENVKKVKAETSKRSGKAAVRRKKSGLSGIVRYVKKHRFIQFLLLLAVLSVVAFTGYRVHHILILQERQAAYEQMAETAHGNRIILSLQDSGVPVVNLPQAEAETKGEAELSLEIVEEEKTDLIETFLGIEGFEEKYGKYLLNGVPDFSVLQQTNEDIVAYLCLPDSVIDYPVLQNEKDDYYLNHNLDGSRGYPGCLYIENVNHPDFSDPVVIVYGHRLFTGGMFSDLDDFLDSAYMDSHQFCFLYLPDEIQIYEVVLAAKYNNLHLLAERFSQVDEDLYEFNGFEGNEGKLIYDKIEALGLEGNFRPEHAPTETDRMMYWSTCLPARDKKMIVGARRITEENIWELVNR